MTKLSSLHDAVAGLVHDGDLIYAAGFTHLIPFAAGHEIIRQSRRELVLARATPDLISDQMVAAGCARQIIFSSSGRPRPPPPPPAWSSTPSATSPSAPPPPTRRATTTGTMPSTSSGIVSLPNRRGSRPGSTRGSSDSPIGRPTGRSWARGVPNACEWGRAGAGP